MQYSLKDKKWYASLFLNFNILLVIPVVIKSQYLQFWIHKKKYEHCICVQQVCSIKYLEWPSSCLPLSPSGLWMLIISSARMPKYPSAWMSEYQSAFRLSKCLKCSSILSSQVPTCPSSAWVPKKCTWIALGVPFEYPLSVKFLFECSSRKESLKHYQKWTC